MPQVTLLGQIATEEPQRVVVRSKRIPRQLAEETRYVLRRYFPELCGVLLYYTGSANGKYLFDWKIALSPDLLKEPKRKLRHTIAHELTHLIQWQQDYIRHRALQTEYAYLSSAFPKERRLAISGPTQDILTLLHYPVTFTLLSRCETEKWLMSSGIENSDFMRNIVKKSTS